MFLLVSGLPFPFSPPFDAAVDVHRVAAFFWYHISAIFTYLGFCSDAYSHFTSSLFARIRSVLLVLRPFFALRFSFTHARSRFIALSFLVPLVRLSLWALIVTPLHPDAVAQSHFVSPFPLHTALIPSYDPHHTATVYIPYSLDTSSSLSHFLTHLRTNTTHTMQYPFTDRASLCLDGGFARHSHAPQLRADKDQRPWAH